MVQLVGNGVRMIGHAHLDPAWMWRMPEGLEAFAATCRSALDRIGEFPGFIFTCSSAAHYAFVEEADPKLFAEIQQAVRDERWSIVGGWWVEADCNVPSGESFVRQALLGQRYFESRFGRMATVGYNVDSFGHNANLPQLLRKAGLTSYVFMRPEQDEKKLDAALFQWEAPSGDRVAAYRLPLHYSNSEYSVREKLRLLHFYDLFTPKQPWMIFFGVGNHGGGPTVEQIREIVALQEEGRKIEFSEPSQFFAGLDIDALPVIRDEMQPHAIGCYSAHSEIKRLNRRAENILGQAEAVAVLSKLVDSTAPNPQFEQAWKNVCFNQFHDILGGVAIKEASDDAITLYRESISIAERYLRTALQRIASRIDTSDCVENLILFNTSAFEREETIEFELWHPHGSERGEVLRSVALVAPDGERVPTQKIEASGKIGEDRVRFAAKVRVPALGWARYGIERHAEAAVASALFVTPEHISNGLTSIDLSKAVMDSATEWANAFEEMDDSPARIPSNDEKILEVEVVKRNESAAYRYARPIAIEDQSDTWGHGLRAFADAREEFGEPWPIVIERGPVRAAVRIETEEDDDKVLSEDIFITEGAEHIEVRAGLNWQRTRSILKFRFPHGCANPVARYEIPYASVVRPTGANEWPGQSWVDVSERDGSHGLAVISDSKYSYSADETYINVIVARSALYAHHVPPHKAEVFGDGGDYLDLGWQEFRFFIVPHEGDWRAGNLSKRSEQLMRPIIVHTKSGHPGDLPSMYSGFEIVGDGIHIGAIKPAESGDGIVVRAIEHRGEKNSAELRIPSPKTSWSAEFHPFEIKSFLIANGNVTEVDLLERPI